MADIEKKYTKEIENIHSELINEGEQIKTIRQNQIINRNNQNKTKEN